jgi:type I restriction enzyme M protein
MGADEQQQELLGALEALGGSAGNGKLRELLGWDEPTYDAVKAPLLSAGLLLAGRGRGGSVSLPGSAPPCRPHPPTPEPRQRLPRLQAPSPAASRTSRPSSGAWPTCCRGITSRATTAR